MSFLKWITTFTYNLDYMKSQLPPPHNKFSLIGSILLCLFVSNKVLSQNECGTGPLKEDYLATQKYVGNNKYLLEVLSKNGLYLPEDYFDQLDTKGLYKGKDLSLKDVRDPNTFKKPDEKETSLSVGRGGSPGTTYYVPLKVWVYQTSAGVQAATQADVEQRFNDLQQFFRQNGVPIEFFIKCPISFITSDQYFNISEDEEDDMWSDFRDTNAMNVHIVGDANSAGVAQNPGECLYIASWSSTSTLAHEIGHNLGLDHTHHGRSPCDSENENCADCWQEPVSRSMGQPAWCGNFNNKKKCEVNGDKLCDTAGEPNLDNQVNLSCQYSFIDPTDNWGATWTPNTRNIMSYSLRDCRTQFTYGQMGVMLDNLPSFASSSTNYSISGPINVCPDQAVTYTAPDFGSGINYHWRVPLGWPIIGQGTRTVSITPTINYGDNTIYVNPICGQKSAKLVLNVNDLTLAITGPSEILDDGYQRPYLAESGATNYNWSVWPDFFIAAQNSNTASIGAYPGAQQGYINVSANACGLTIWGSKLITIGGGGPNPLLASPEVLVYPNPVDELLTIKLTGEFIDKTLQVEVIDILTGKVLIHKNETSREINIDMTKFSSGFYILKYSNDGKTVTKKLIKK